MTLNSQKSGSSPQRYTQGFIIIFFFLKKKRHRRSVAGAVEGGMPLRTYMDSHSSLLVRCA